jgi:hypothetical protein
MKPESSKNVSEIQARLVYFMESCTFALVKKILLHSRHLILACCLLPVVSTAQSATYGSSAPRNNAFTFNLGQLVVNEINLGIEHYFTDKKSIEYGGGLIYRNDFWLKLAEDWANSQYFYEHGFALRLAHKIYHKANDKTGRKNYHSFGMNYQYLAFNNKWFETEEELTLVLKPSNEEIQLQEEIFMHRFRHRIGLQVTLGHLIPLDETFALDLYYGMGVRGVFSNRFDVARGVTYNGEQVTLEYLNYEDRKFYMRPTIHAGVKLRIAW